MPKPKGLEVVSPTAGAVIAHPITTVPENLLTVANHFGVNTEDLGELARIGADSMNRAMFEIARAGLAFMRAQELLSLGLGGDRSTKLSIYERSEIENGGGFVAWIEQHGLAMPRVYEAMRIAKFVAQLPQDQLNDVLQLGKVKVMLLSSLPQDVIDNAAESGNGLIERADMMTVAELKAEIKDLRRREKNYEAELERAGNQVKRLSEGKLRTSEFLLRTEELREECLALQLGGELHLNSLRKLFDETDLQAPEGTLQAEQVWITANTLAARALDLVEHIRALGPQELPSRPTGEHTMTPEEAQAWLLNYPLIENRHAAQAAVRESQREGARPKGPGRPKGSGNKAGA